MTVFKVETNNQADIDKKPRICFTCHPDDFDRYFKKICNDIFKTHDCAIYYTENMTEVIAEDEKEIALGRNHLFVVPVTYKLLSSPNRAMDEDIPYALKEHIPVLPIMMESEIDEFYSKADKFGDLQYLNPYSTDLTEISYEDKLKKYLDSVLVSKEMAARIRDAFDSYVFLSYRKKDRKYANELVRLIHRIPECRDIAIWFDEFLTPGESFKDNIEKILDKSKLFTLLVTPSLLEKPNGKPNYVMAEEYPAAYESGKIILPAEMKKTDKKNLSKNFKGIPVCVKPDSQKFRSVFIESVSNHKTESENSPEHKFLVGLAYLEGIYMEVNRATALKLITEAAETNLPEAMEKLRNMYYSGTAVERNYNTAIELTKKLVKYFEEKQGIESLETIDAYEDLAHLFYEVGDYSESVQILRKAYELRLKISENKNVSALETMKNYATMCYIAGTECWKCEKKDGVYTYYFSDDKLLNESKQLFEKLYALQVEMNGENDIKSLLALCDLALCYSYNDISMSKECADKVFKTVMELNNYNSKHFELLITLSLIYEKLDYDKALKLATRTYHLSRSVFGSESSEYIRVLEQLARLRYRKDLPAGNITEDESITNIDDYEIACSFLEEAYEKKCRILGEDNISTLNTLSELSYIYQCLDEEEKQIEAMKKVYEGQYKVFGKEDPRTLDTLEMLNEITEL